MSPSWHLARRAAGDLALRFDFGAVNRPTLLVAGLEPDSADQITARVLTDYLTLYRDRASDR